MVIRSVFQKGVPVLALVFALAGCGGKDETPYEPRAKAQESEMKVPEGWVCEGGMCRRVKSEEAKPTAAVSTSEQGKSVKEK